MFGNESDGLNSEELSNCQAFVCIPPLSKFNLESKLVENQYIKIRTPVTEYQACSGIIKPKDDSIIKVSNIDRNLWSDIC